MMGKKRRSTARIDSLIGQNTEIQGDVVFTGGLHVDGKVKGNVIARDAGSLLTVSDQGVVEGEVRVPSIVLNGVVNGDVYAGERIELASRARVSGNVYYNLIEMAIGAEVNGKLVHRTDSDQPRLTHMRDAAEAELAEQSTPTPARVSNS
ncbi:MAG: polymer-forming cytoskeletal protein [Gammaproteobacteria bacterium]|nr:polymer-forming cytoskeletal protein [Gammaproteobacteria bacterium]MDH5727569.1 polymer-forming cytoskeletal protein [Gammaproteobacteria bacterium]